jgi:hypothetical protein
MNRGAVEKKKNHNFFKEEETESSRHLRIFIQAPLSYSSLSETYMASHLKIILVAGINIMCISFLCFHFLFQNPGGVRINPAQNLFYGNWG